MKTPRRLVRSRGLSTEPAIRGHRSASPDTRRSTRIPGVHLGTDRQPASTTRTVPRSDMPTERRDNRPRARQGQLGDGRLRAVDRHLDVILMDNQGYPSQSLRENCVRLAPAISAVLRPGALPTRDDRAHWWMQVATTSGTPRVGKRRGRHAGAEPFHARCSLTSTFSPDRVVFVQDSARSSVRRPRVSRMPSPTIPTPRVKCSQSSALLSGMKLIAPPLSISSPNTHNPR